MEIRTVYDLSPDVPWSLKNRKLSLVGNQTSFSDYGVITEVGVGRENPT